MKVCPRTECGSLAVKRLAGGFVCDKCGARRRTFPDLSSQVGSQQGDPADYLGGSSYKKKAIRYDC